MNEQIFLNGVPAVGFGEGPLEAMSKVPLVGVIVGASGGGLLGYLLGKNVGGVVGALLGGIGGVLVETAVAKAAPATPSSPPATSTPAQMLPGQVWTTVGIVRPTKPWTNVSKSDVEAAVTIALSKIGLSLRDGSWTADYTFTIGIYPVRATVLPDTLPIVSEWADQITFFNVAQAPVAQDWTL